MTEGRPIPITWTCNQCSHEHHRDNLLKKTRAVHMEQAIGVVRPDILLVDGENRPLVAVEVVVTHPPDPAAVSFYRENGIVLLEIPVLSAEALEALRHLTTLTASNGSACLRKKCPTCRGPLMDDPLYVVDADCYRCHKSMKVAFKCSQQEGLVGPEDFSEDEAARARRAACILRQHWSDTLKRRYLASTCGHCNAFVGQFYLHDYADEVHDTKQQEEVYCPKCRSYSTSVRTRRSVSG